MRFLIYTKQILCNTSALGVMITGLMLTSSLSFAIAQPGSMSEKKTCRVKTNDIGTIVGRGKNDSEAFEDAATQCFDKREERYKAAKHASLDEEAGLVMIDVCANIKCG